MSRSVANANPPVIAGEAKPNPLVTINEKARAAKDGDVTATRELVDEMFRMFDFAQEFAELDDSIKERLVRAQLNHSRRVATRVTGSLDYSEGTLWLRN